MYWIKMKKKISSIFQLAKAEKLKPLEVELRRLEDLSKSIVDDFEYMKSREKEMRDTNGKYQKTWYSCNYTVQKGTYHDWSLRET